MKNVIFHIEKEEPVIYHSNFVMIKFVFDAMIVSTTQLFVFLFPLLQPYRAQIDQVGYIRSTKYPVNRVSKRLRLSSIFRSNRNLMMKMEKIGLMIVTLLMLWHVPLSETTITAGIV